MNISDACRMADKRVAAAEAELKAAAWRQTDIGKDW